MGEYVDFEIKPNLPVLGQEYGKLIPRIRAVSYTHLERTRVFFRRYRKKATIDDKFVIHSLRHRI